MRLFEVDLGSARDVLAVFQGQADKEGQSASLPFAAVMRMIRPFHLGISTPDGLIALKNKIDPTGDVISEILPNGTVVLNTKQKNPTQQEPAGNAPSIDAMASRNSKPLNPKV